MQAKDLTVSDRLDAFWSKIKTKEDRDRIRTVTDLFEITFSRYNNGDIEYLKNMSMLCASVQKLTVYTEIAACPEELEEFTNILLDDLVKKQPALRKKRFTVVS